MMDNSAQRRRAPQSWIDAIGRGEADLAAGRVYDLEPFLRELEAEDTAALAAEATAARTRGRTVAS